MIKNAKEARALGLAWLDMKFRLPDGSHYEIKGPYSQVRSVQIFKIASDVDVAADTVLRAAGKYGHEVPS